MQIQRQAACLSYLSGRLWINTIDKLAIVALSLSCVSSNEWNMYKHSTGNVAQSNYAEGIDISHHQGAIDWQQCTPGRSGKTFVIAKATEGATYQDPNFLQNVAQMRAAGFQPGAYHFLRFGSSSPEAQMKNFVSQLSNAGLLADKASIIALDVEEHDGADYTLVQRVTEQSVRYLNDYAKVMPYIYTSTSFWNKYVAVTPDIVQKCPLWIARWREQPPLPDELPRGWRDWSIWQYDSRGPVQGITGPVDLNRMKRV
ncbi:Glycosyl hydrolases family 25 [Cardinium endosymbiont of Sogatella furcifera]|uniref:glycoside hydrolase family 25 protein n=1 Tax=Cardinium endosymbiont of Sogatella furcifera TaxID=650378 RepID=UPI000E0DED38|nr:glycoside hydrolase family 25 protein [Cardinium endosymbiont of Sogatella furcifera]AXI24208.1 Glycosyl hydrolases family 25 [Cardinium endosymbiont of Sogatella furcifera]